MNSTTRTLLLSCALFVITFSTSILLQAETNCENEWSYAQTTLPIPCLVDGHWQIVNITYYGTYNCGKLYQVMYYDCEGQQHVKWYNTTPISNPGHSSSPWMSNSCSNSNTYKIWVVQSGSNNEPMKLDGIDCNGNYYQAVAIP